MFHNPTQRLENLSFRKLHSRRPNRNYRPVLDGLTNAMELERKAAPGTFSVVSQAVSANAQSRVPASWAAPNPTPSPDIGGDQGTSGAVASSGLGNSIIGNLVRVSQGQSVYVDLVDASEQGIGNTQLHVTSDLHNVQIQSSHQHIDTVTVNDQNPNDIYGVCCDFHYAQITTLTGNYDLDVSNTAGLTATINFTIHIDPTEDNFSDVGQLSFTSNHLNVWVGINEDGPIMTNGSSAPPGITIADAATGMAPSTVKPNFSAGDWNLQIQTTVDPEELANYTSQFITGPDGNFAYTGAPGGEYSETVAFTWSYSMTLNT